VVLFGWCLLAFLMRQPHLPALHLKPRSAHMYSVAVYTTTRACCNTVHAWTRSLPGGMPCRVYGFGCMPGYVFYHTS
jgi:hypothetical protein